MEESLLFVKYDLKKLNILDVEKKTLTLKNSEELERLCNYSYFFFSLSSANANLLLYT